MHSFLLSADIFNKINIFIKYSFAQEYHQSTKQFGSRSRQLFSRPDLHLRKLFAKAISKQLYQIESGFH